MLVFLNLSVIDVLEISNDEFLLIHSMGVFGIFDTHSYFLFCLIFYL